MNARQRLYFRTKLIAWKEDIIRQTRETLEGLTSTSEHHADIADRATSETDRALELQIPALDDRLRVVLDLDVRIHAVPASPRPRPSSRPSTCSGRCSWYFSVNPGLRKKWPTTSTSRLRL